MPFNGSGSFSPPAADFPAVPNTLIESAKFNDVINDIAVGLSTCVTKDGQTTATAAIPFAAGIKTNTVQELTATTGVTVDGVLLKDAGVDASGAGALSGQFKFPATQNPSTNANTLDDYEEGTWTPTMAFGGASVGITYDTTRVGRYVKVGKQVTIWGRFILTSKGSSTGAATVTGLPFVGVTSTGLVQLIPVIVNAGASGGMCSPGTIASAGASIGLGRENGVNYTALSDVDYTNTSDISFSGSYEAST